MDTDSFTYLLEIMFKTKNHSIKSRETVPLINPSCLSPSSPCHPPPLQLLAHLWPTVCQNTTFPFTFYSAEEEKKLTFLRISACNFPFLMPDFFCTVAFFFWLTCSVYSPSSPFLVFGVHVIFDSFRWILLVVSEQF
jgi:hypothetical protein